MDKTIQLNIDKKDGYLYDYIKNERSEDKMKARLYELVQFLYMCKGNPNKEVTPPSDLALYSDCHNDSEEDLIALRNTYIKELIKCTKKLIHSEIQYYVDFGYDIRTDCDMYKMNDESLLSPLILYSYYINTIDEILEKRK